MCGAAAIGVQLIAVPLLIVSIFDSISNHQKRDFIASIAMLSCAYAALLSTAYLKLVVGQRVKNQIFKGQTTGLLRSFFQIAHGDVLERGNGYYLSRLCDEPLNVSQSADLLVDIFTAILSMIVAYTMMSIFSWRLALIFMVIPPISYSLARGLAQKIHGATLAERDDLAALRGILGKMIQSFKTVRIFSLSNPVSAKYERFANLYTDRLYNLRMTLGLYGLVSQVGISIGELAVFIGGGIEVFEGGLSFGVFLVPDDERKIECGFFGLAGADIDVLELERPG
jgi:ABC-type multidrug transport system fused ATPase/permease subunit